MYYLENILDFGVQQLGNAFHPRAAVLHKQIDRVLTLVKQGHSMFVTQLSCPLVNAVVQEESEFSVVVHVLAQGAHGHGVRLERLSQPVGLLHVEL